MSRILPFVCVVISLNAFSQPVETSETQGDCKVKDIGILIIGDDTKEGAEFGRQVVMTMSRYPCYKVVDLTENLEAGMGIGAARVEEGKEELEQGQSLFDEMKFSEAKEHFRLAVEAFSEGFAYLPYLKPIIDALMYYGATQAITGDRENAIKSFMKAIALKDNVSVDDYSILPEPKSAFERAKQLITLGANGSLSVVTEPPGVEVFIDGHFLGISPLIEPSITAGPHFIVLSKVGYMKKSLAIDVPPGQNVNISSPDGDMEPAKRKQILDGIRKKISSNDPERIRAGIEDLSGILLTSRALVVQILESDGTYSVEFSMWDLTSQQKVWGGRYPEQGFVSTLGRGIAENLISLAVEKDEGRTKIKTTQRVTKRGILSKWWFWTAVGVAVAGGTTTALLLSMKKGHEAKGFKHDHTGAVVIRF